MSHKKKKTRDKECSSDEGKTVVAGSRVEQEKSIKFTRKEGESLNCYLDRIDTESRTRLVELSKRAENLQTEEKGMS